ncbi:MAG: cupin domain-containing protein [Nitrososphaeria archaeon]|nr:cupin domain-containing protein [Nitrososphaeria archaeon]NIN52625.1 cupin domain-containing protein [Nitrososphaeria archaeon]NIQ33100.1 cupin domain-containing protein [Nitrososphaeria archaeon]
MIVETEDIPGAKVPEPNERVLKVVMSPEIGNYEKLTVLVSIISPGNSTGYHTHGSDEIMYVATGRGEGVVDGETKKIRVDSLIYAAKGVKHEVKNAGDETLKLICFYSPPIKPAGYFEEAINKAKEYFT